MTTTDLSTRTLRALLAPMHPCSEGAAYAAQHQTLKSAWENCPNPEWMRWFLEKLGCRDDRAYRLFGCWCVRQVWHLLTDERSRSAVEVAERFAVGEATQEELVAAWAAARAASDAACVAASVAAWAAARAASDAACVAASAAASDAACVAASVAQASKLRELFPYSEIQRLVRNYRRRQI